MGKYKVLIAALFLFSFMIAAFFLGKSVGSKMTGSPVLPLDVEPKAVVSREVLLAVVLDDVGYSGKNFGGIRELDVPLTLAVLPNLKYSRQACEFARENGLDVILHLPMEPEAETWAREKDTVISGMSPEEVEEILCSSLKSVPGAVGVSNHMGSRATGDKEAVMSLMMSLKKRGLFFLDSKTTAFSVCEKEADYYGVPYLKRDVFLDNKTDTAYVLGKMTEAGDVALKKGAAIAIGHDRENTVKAIKAILPELKKKGIRFATLGEIKRKAGVFGREGH